ncbi:MAG: hypothetical protein ACOYNL_02200, partial [Rickettsiales bacterium]
DNQGIVASILRNHDAHHGNTADGDHCHTTHGEMIGGGSQRIENTLRRILDNGSMATAEQRQWAKWWMERNAAPDLSSTSPKL